MRAFRALTLNTVRSSLRNRVSLFFTLGLAVLFMVIFGELFGGNNFSITFGIVDDDHSAQSQQFVSTLGHIKGVTVEQGSQDNEINRLKNNNVDVVVDIPSGFGAALANPGAPAGAGGPIPGKPDVVDARRSPTRSSGRCSTGSPRRARRR